MLRLIDFPPQELLPDEQLDLLLHEVFLQLALSLQQAFLALFAQLELQDFALLELDFDLQLEPQDLDFLQVDFELQLDLLLHEVFLLQHCFLLSHELPGELAKPATVLLYGWPDTRRALICLWLFFFTLKPPS